MPRGLIEFRLGDGVSGGLPGNDGAQTICSGVIESLLTDRFSLPSISESMLFLWWSLDIEDDIDAERSRCKKSPDRRRTDRSNGVVVCSLSLQNMEIYVSFFLTNALILFIVTLMVPPSFSQVSHFLHDWNLNCE